MDYKLISTSQTEKDVERIILWYLEKSKTLAKEFFVDLELTKVYLSKNPKQLQIRYSDVRVAFLQKFPYGIHFILNENLVVIIAVFGTSEDPEKWNDR